MNLKMAKASFEIFIKMIKAFSYLFIYFEEGAVLLKIYFFHNPFMQRDRHVFALLISMLRSKSNNFNQNRPKIKLFVQKSSKFLSVAFRPPNGLRELEAPSQTPETAPLLPEAPAEIFSGGASDVSIIYWIN